MIRTFTVFIFILYLVTGIRAQIVIDDEDMPEPGDTIRKSNTFILDGIDYELTGPGFNWDFSSLALTAQQVDTFVNVTETPFIYQAFFNNQFLYPDHKATVAYKISTFSGLPGFQFSDSYQFLKNSPESYREVGYGVSYQGFTVPIQYSQIDTLYRFPLTYGQIDSSTAFFEVDIPDFIYASIDRKRKNVVDGWGTLTTPFGQFQTLRVKTEIQEYDSVYIDSLSTGIPLDRNYTEYKWLAKGFHAPVLQVTVEGFLVTASYIDTLRSIFSGIYDFHGRNVHFSVYPNPSDDFVSLSYELMDDAVVSISLYSVYGKELRMFMQTQQERGLYTRVLYLKEYGFKPGIYLLRLTVDNVPYIKRILLN